MDLSGDLLKACAVGLGAEISSLLAEGADANYINEDGYFPLIVATQAQIENDAEVIGLLLSAGAEVNMRHAATGSTALCCAAMLNNVTAIAALLEGGADINAPRTLDAVGATPLFIACQEGNVEALRLLVSYGADPNASVSSMDSACALYVAAQDGNVEIVRELLAVPGILVNQETFATGLTPLYIACEGGHAEVVALLLAAGGAVDRCEHEDDFPPLHIAAQQGFADIVRLLLKAGANRTFATRATGQTALDLALALDHPEVVALLSQPF